MRALHDQLTALGAEVGLIFDFDRVQVGSTFDAHRLAQAARGTPSEEALVRGLFAANFSEGRLLSDHGVLRDVAAAAGLDEALTDEVLAGDAFGLEVRADEAAARERDVTGVPVLPDQRRLAGARAPRTSRRWASCSAARWSRLGE